MTPHNICPIQVKQLFSIFEVIEAQKTVRHSIFPGIVWTLACQNEGSIRMVHSFRIYGWKLLELLKVVVYVLVAKTDHSSGLSEIVLVLKTKPILMNYVPTNVKTKLDVIQYFSK